LWITTNFGRPLGGAFFQKINAQADAAPDNFLQQLNIRRTIIFVPHKTLYAVTVMKSQYEIFDGSQVVRGGNTLIKINTITLQMR
jgi:hypothetical protein